jgi:ribokinase
MTDHIDAYVLGGAMIDTFIFPQDSHLSDNDKEISFSYGSKIQLRDMFNHIGGGGANISVGLARHNKNVCFTTKLGNDDTGTCIRNELEKEKVNITKLLTGTLPTGASIIVQGEGEDRTIFTYRGANAELIIEDVDVDQLMRSTYVIITALYSQSIHLLPQIVHILEHTSVKIALSIGIPEIEFLGHEFSRLLPHIDTIILNEEEGRELYHVLAGKHHDHLAHCPLCDDNISEVLSFLKNQGMKNIGITLASHGAIFIDEKGEHYSVPAKKVPVTNTTGVGDAFYSGYISYQLTGKSVTESIEHGIDNATSVMEYYGAQLGLLRN